ncbi:hypothetical protein [uncultured Desulfovibrio sp.]|uniref:hypothetical protein n=1 Tax=uncultured Desulfovibrio sp. TaxID=167968 RepID=UPI00266EF9CB|nr:hypothetical protein [uncultured Desulfovibrio sp.]
MEQRFFDSMLDEIYSVFGRQRPAYGTPAYRSLWRRVVEERGVPNEAAKHIAYALSERDSLPLNLGKAILAEFDNWLAEHPEKRARMTACPECSSDMPGFFWAWDAGRRVVCKCACNSDRRFEKFQAWTHRQALAAGLTLRESDMAQDIPGNIPSDIRASLGHCEPPRPAHVAQVEYSNTAGW